MDFGDSIKRLRERSPFRDRRTFAKRVGITSEGLRKIENGDRVPNRDTLTSILTLAGIPDHAAGDYWTAWNSLQAGKYGVKVSVGVTPRELSKLAVETVKDYLLKNRCELHDDWENELAAELEVILGSRILS